MQLKEHVGGLVATATATATVVPSAVASA